MKRLVNWLTGKRQPRMTVTARWFTASLIEANSRAGRLAYGVAI